MDYDGRFFLIGMVLCITLLGCVQQPPADVPAENLSPAEEPEEAPEGPEGEDVTEAEEGEEAPEENVTETEEYDPEIDPAAFTSDVTNKYFALPPGKKMVYNGETEEGTETIEVYVLNETRMVMGVETIVVWDRVWLEGELIEDTKDWYAQDSKGDVWYFGEESFELLDGKVVSTEGSWESGVDGAKPGIIMKAEPAVGDSYRQEYYEGEAEDMGEVLALGESVSVPSGDYTGCVKTLDWTPLEPGVEEHKYYCPEVSGVVLEVALEDEERVELISVAYGAEPSPSAVEEEPEELQKDITEEEAKQIALAEVPGKVTGVEIEKKYGKLSYVVEVDAEDGPETDIIIDIETGEILGIET